MPDVCRSRGIIALLLVIVTLLCCPMVAFASEAEEAPQNPLATLLNNVELEPINPGSQTLNAYLDDLLPQIINDEMDTYQKVKACYDYVYGTVSYGSHLNYLGTEVRDGVTCRDIYSAYGAVEGFGAVALTAKRGMCNAYASAFILMARKIGLNAYLVKGSTRSARGGYAYHEWAEIQIDGTIYLFDPQLEQNLSRTETPQYMVFCKTYAEVPGRYNKY